MRVEPENPEEKIEKFRFGCDFQTGRTAELEKTECTPFDDNAFYISDQNESDR